MKLPAKVRITSKVSYEVLYSHEIKNDPTCAGYCCDKKRQITLKIGQSDRDLVKSFIHEVFHALEFEWKIPIPHKVIYMLEEAVFKVLVLNKWI